MELAISGSWVRVRPAYFTLPCSQWKQVLGPPLFPMRHLLALLLPVLGQCTMVNRFSSPFTGLGILGLSAQHSTPLSSTLCVCVCVLRGGQLVSSPCSGESDRQAQVESGRMYGQKDTDNRQRPQLLERSHQKQAKALGMGPWVPRGYPPNPTLAS